MVCVIGGTGGARCCGSGRVGWGCHWKLWIGWEGACDRFWVVRKMRRAVREGEGFRDVL